MHSGRLRLAITKLRAHMWQRRALPLYALILPQLISCGPRKGTVKPEEHNNGANSCLLLSSQLIPSDTENKNQFGIHGTVYSAGKPVPDFVIVATDREDSLKQADPPFETVTVSHATRGDFALEVPTKRDLVLQFFHASYLPCFLFVRIAPGQALFLKVEPEPRPPNEEVMLLTGE